MKKGEHTSIENPDKSTSGTDFAKAKESVAAAHEQADHDIEEDPELNSEEDPEKDLDEGELARLDNSNDEGEI